METMTFERLCDLSRTRADASDDDILAAIKSGSRPADILAARHLFGSNSPGVFGLIIEEAGKRQLRAAAPLVVEYCAWPRDNDFWGHVVPKTCRALKNIGDLSCVPRIEEIASLARVDADLLRSTIRSLTQYSPTDDLAPRPEEEGSLTFDAEGTTIIAAYGNNVLSPDDIIKWADSKILEWAGPPPEWLCDLSINGFVDLSGMASEFKEPSLVDRVRVLACGQLTGHISVSDALLEAWNLRREDQDATLREGALAEPYVDLLMAAREWGWCEVSGVNPAVLADWESGYLGSWPGGDIRDPWMDPDQLDYAGKILFERALRDLAWIGKDAGAVLSLLKRTPE